VKSGASNRRIVGAIDSYQSASRGQRVCKKPGKPFARAATLVRVLVPDQGIGCHAVQRLEIRGSQRTQANQRARQRRLEIKVDHGFVMPL
jgi:hypothetical protein